MMNKQSPKNPDPHFWNNKTVLLTGHTGFKGSWLSAWLLEMGAIVVGVSLPSGETESLYNSLDIAMHIQDHRFDIRNKNLVDSLFQDVSPDVVIHMAAQSLVRESYNSPLETWETNVIGTIHLLENLRRFNKRCSAIVVTTDKVYKNCEWNYGYRETDPLGGNDPYSSSKAAVELAVASWQHSFIGSARHQTSALSLATARAGNVVGGGDWAKDRIVPDIIRALRLKKDILIRNPSATRPWQHVLEPLCGYLILAEKLYRDDMQANYPTSYNFGPFLQSNRSVEELVNEVIRHWKGKYKCSPLEQGLHESSKLNLVYDKAYHDLGWSPRWSFEKTIEYTIKWYKDYHHHIQQPLNSCLQDLSNYLLPQS